MALRFKTHKQRKIRVGGPVPYPVRVMYDCFQYPTTRASQYICAHLKEDSEQVCSYVKDTAAAVRCIESTVIRGPITIIAADVDNHFPSAPQRQCKATAASLFYKKYSPAKAAFLVKLENLVTQNIVCTDHKARKWKQSDGYGIGIAHSNEITNIEFGSREAWLNLETTRRGMEQPAIYIRRVDDILVVRRGTPAEAQPYISLMREMDPNRPLTVQCSDRTVDWCDLTVYVGDRHRKTGVLDVRLYQKPTDEGRYLPRCSHHPESTFKAILLGEARRMLIVNSSHHTWRRSLITKVQQFSWMGYKPGEVATTFMGAFRWSERASALQDKQRNSAPVVAFKVPYNKRTAQLQTSKALQYWREQAALQPELAAAAGSSRWVVAHQKTSTLQDLIKPYKITANK